MVRQIREPIVELPGRRLSSRTSRYASGGRVTSRRVLAARYAAMLLRAMSSAILWRSFS